MQFTFKKIIYRLLLLLVPIVILWTWQIVTFDPHARCIGDEHRHVDGFMGVALLSVIWFFSWLSFVVLEMVFWLVKKYFYEKP